jgi:SWI/SNF-related matrix-associated actin-dependent regulator of chromatin subfamily B protein 1
MTSFFITEIQYDISQELPPHSLIEAHAAMNAKYPDDRFDIWPRTAPTGEQEWRVKCLDCPGKVRRNS